MAKISILMKREKVTWQQANIEENYKIFMFNSRNRKLRTLAEFS